MSEHWHGFPSGQCWNFATKLMARMAKRAQKTLRVPETNSFKQRAQTFILNLQSTELPSLQTWTLPSSLWLLETKMAALAAATVEKRCWGRKTWSVTLRFTWTAFISATFVKKSPRPEVLWPCIIPSSTKTWLRPPGQWSHPRKQMSTKVVHNVHPLF